MKLGKGDCTVASYKGTVHNLGLNTIGHGYGEKPGFLKTDDLYLRELPEPQVMNENQDYFIIMAKILRETLAP